MIYVPQPEQLPRAFLQHEDVFRAYLRLRAQVSKGYAALNRCAVVLCRLLGFNWQRQMFLQLEVKVKFAWHIRCELIETI
jgi:hypothetical protein